MNLTMFTIVTIDAMRAAQMLHERQITRLAELLGMLALLLVGIGPYGPRGLLSGAQKQRDRRVYGVIRPRLAVVAHSAFDICSSAEKAWRRHHLTRLP